MSDANGRGSSDTGEPLTEAEFVEVTRREAFQRFGHEGQARVLAAMAEKPSASVSPRSAIWRRQGDEGKDLHARPDARDYTTRGKTAKSATSCE